MKHPSFHHFISILLDSRHSSSLVLERDPVITSVTAYLSEFCLVYASPGDGHTMCRKCCQCPGLDTPLRCYDPRVICYRHNEWCLAWREGGDITPPIIITGKPNPYLCLIKRLESC